MSASLHVLLALSLAGALLLPLFGLAARLQPTFLRGLHADPRAAERNCYLAAACYAATFVLSCATLWLRHRRASSQAAAATPPISSAAATATATASKPTQVQLSKKSPRSRRRTASRSASPSKSRRSAVP